eukprot:CAMPEP_0177777414 /NCGR_PEP_ID=MMETSP0491_2-20121128/15351_1 /TAXON_ID=63592 /ORGANISM="Tetraselmis chuii, Strain PLY429" /LENGTH=239 /DNA_ID=CAMNT_0019296505 /DNA_START=568 /DNA_END=1287 /DNA_ORIENTATION=+
MGHENLGALIDELCNEDENEFPCNELADVLAGSLRFTSSVVCFLRAAASARLCNQPEHYCSLLRSGISNMSTLVNHCMQSVEPIGVEPAHGTIDAVLEALASQLHVSVELRDFPSIGNFALYPLDEAERNGFNKRTHLHLGYNKAASRFFVLYKSSGQGFPHYSRVRAWAARRAMRGLGNRKALLSRGCMSYPPQREVDPAARLVEAMTETSSTQQQTIKTRPSFTGATQTVKPKVLFG